MRQLRKLLTLALAFIAFSAVPRIHAQRDRQDDRNRPNNQARGQWLLKNKDLPPDQQQKALERDPEYRRLSPERQQQLRQQLEKFNSMPPQQRQVVIQRMENWDRLTPQQKLRARNVYNQLRQLPPDRRLALNREAHNLSALPPQQREQELNSPALKTSFSDSERDTLRNILDLGLAAPQPRTNGSDPNRR